MKHHYPSTPLKKTRDDPSKKKRKKKKLRKKKVEKEEKREIDAEAEDISLISEQTFDDFISLEGAETPESVIVAIPNFVTREGEKLLEDKLNRLKQQRRRKEREFREQYEKSLAKTKADKSDDKHDTNEDESYYADDQNEGIVDDFAGALAEKIVDDTLSFANVEPEVDLTSSYAQALASAIVTRAVNNAVGILTEKFEKEKQIHNDMVNESKIVKEKSLVKESDIVKGKPSAKVLDNFKEKSSVEESSVVKADIVKRKPSMKRSATIHDIRKNVSTETDDKEMVSKNMDDYNTSLQRSGRKTTSPVRFSEKQVDFESHCISTRWVIKSMPTGPRPEKTRSLGFPTKRDSNQSPQLQRLGKNWNFTCSKFTYDTFQKANNKGADQTAQMRWLVCIYVVCKPRKTDFLASSPNWGSCRVRTGLESTWILKAFLKSHWKLDLPWKVLENHSKAWKSAWILLFSVELITVDRNLNQNKIVVPLFGAAYAAPNVGKVQ